jgi:FkbM family methyltransferase
MNFVFPAIRKWTENWVYTVRWGLAKGMKRKGGLQFLPQITPLRPEEKLLLSMDLAGKTVYDIGGYEGIFTLFFAKSVGEKGHVVTFEPNPVNHGKIKTNLELNGLKNVVLVPKGVGDRTGTLRLVIPGALRESGTVNPEAQKKFIQGKDVRTYNVEVGTLDDMIRMLGAPDPDFVKIDIEGFECEALKGGEKLLHRVKPPLLIEVHTHCFDTVENKKEYLGNLLAILGDFGYQITCVETGECVQGMDSGSLFEESHFYCTAG